MSKTSWDSIQRQFAIFDIATGIKWTTRSDKW